MLSGDELEIADGHFGSFSWPAHSVAVVSAVFSAWLWWLLSSIFVCSDLTSSRSSSCGNTSIMSDTVKIPFLPCGHFGFESAVTAQNDESKGSFDSSYSRLLNVNT